MNIMKNEKTMQIRTGNVDKILSHLSKSLELSQQSQRPEQLQIVI